MTDNNQIFQNEISGSDAHAVSIKKDSIVNTLTVAFLVSLVCSVLVSTSVVLLRPKQLQNQLAHSGDINVIALMSAIQPDKSVDEIVNQFDTRMIDLATGDYVTDIDISQFNPRAATKDPELGVTVPPDLDMAGIERRARYAVVQLIRENEHIKYIVLPVYGSGMWSTLYGYLALEADGNTIAGLKFYEHAETPGIGDKVDNPVWLTKWQGKKIYDENNLPAIEIVKGKVPVETDNQVDALTGATMTGKGVTNLLRYWLGPHGFRPFLEKLRNEDDRYDK